MKRIPIIIILVCILFTILGCVPSIHSFYTDKELTFDSTLLGTWVSKDGNESYVFTRSGDQGYSLMAYSKDSVPATFDAHLFKLENMLYIDTYPEKLDIKNEFLAMHAIPAHILTRIELKGDTVEASMLSPDKIEQMKKNHKLGIKSETVKDGILLTASSKELQDFIKKNQNTIFENPEVLSRKK